MLLRRLTRSLEEQNWTAISVEFVLLVSCMFPDGKLAKMAEATNPNGETA